MEFAHNLASEHLISPLFLRGVNQLSHDIASFRVGRTTLFKEYLLEFLYLCLTKRAFDNSSNILNDKSIYNPFKVFPPFHIAEGHIPFAFFDPKTGFSLKRGEPYLSIHMGKYFSLKPTGEDINEGLAQVASYMETHGAKLPGDSIIGVTYIQLARAARLYGFSLTSTPLPPKIEKMISNNTKNEKVNQRFRNSGVALCFQSFDDLIVRFKAKPT